MITKEVEKNKAYFDRNADNIERVWSKVDEDDDEIDDDDCQ